jgi:hypothetical protein
MPYRKALGSIVLAAFALPTLAFAQYRTTVTIRLNETLSSGSSQPGDSFSGALDAPLVVGDRIVAESGTRVAGQVIEAVSSERVKSPARLTLRLTAVEIRRNIPMRTGDLTVKAGSYRARNLLIIGGSAALGSAIGASAGGGRGAAIGAAAGAGAGAVGAYLNGRREIVLPAETRLTFHVNSVTISPSELARLQPLPAVNPEALPEPRAYRVLHHGREDDDDDQGEDEHEHRHVHRHHGDYEHEDENEDEERRCPRTIDVVFYPHSRAVIILSWPQRVERLTLEGEDLDDILQPLSIHTRVSISILRPRIRVKRDD